MEREYSAGGVVLRTRQQRWWVAVIEPQGRRKPGTPASAPATVLALPKGNVDQGEKPEETAVREVREETGVEAALVAKLSDIKYIYVRSWGDRQRVFKVVSFFLLRYRSGRIGQAILFDLRRRTFDHVQALSVSFHERFTSGRVISRLTSDVDTLTELLDSGLDGLLTAMLNIAAITVILLVLDPPLAGIARTVAFYRAHAA